MIVSSISDAGKTAKLLQSCPTLCDPIDGSPPGSAVPGILQARTLEWVAISFSNAWKWKVKVKSLSCVRLVATPWTAAYQARPSMDFPGKSTGVGCHRLHLAKWVLCLPCPFPVSVPLFVLILFPVAWLALFPLSPFFHVNPNYLYNLTHVLSFSEDILGYWILYDLLYLVENFYLFFFFFGFS